MKLNQNEKNPKEKERRFSWRKIKLFLKILQNVFLRISRFFEEFNINKCDIFHDVKFHSKNLENIISLLN